MKVIECLQAYREDGDDLTFDHYSIVLSHGTELFKAQSQLEYTVPLDIDAEQLDCPLISIHGPSHACAPPATK